MNFQTHVMYCTVLFHTVQILIPEEVKKNCLHQSKGKLGEI